MYKRWATAVAILTVFCLVFLVFEWSRLSTSYHGLFSDLITTEEGPMSVNLTHLQQNASSQIPKRVGYTLPTVARPSPNHTGHYPLTINRFFTILFATDLNGHPWYATMKMITCGRSLKCKLVGDKRLFSSSDAVVFCGRGSNLFKSVREIAALPRPPNQRWVMYNREPPQFSPSLNELNGLINWTITYMKESDLRHTYASVMPGVFHGGFQLTRDYLAEKTEMAAILVSRCVQSRMSWVSKLQQYIDIHVYGRCGPYKCSNSSECMSILKKHKFYLSFENSFCQDYITEKFYGNALRNGIVPVVLSGANFSDPSVVPPGSFINVLDFSSVKELAKYMKKVGGNSTLYSEYFRWHSNYTIGSPSNVWCDLCQRLDSDRDSAKVYNYIGSSYSSKRLCKEYPVPH